MRDRKNLNKERNRKISRRDFMGAAAAAAAFTFVPRHVLGGRRYISPSDKLNVACIGVGGMGGSDVGQRRQPGQQGKYSGILRRRLETRSRYFQTLSLREDIP